LIYSSILYNRLRRRKGSEYTHGAIETVNDKDVGAEEAGVSHPIPRGEPTIEDDDSGFEEPAPDYESVVGSGGGLPVKETQKFNDV
jgi:hypothetical protein